MAPGSPGPALRSGSPEKQTEREKSQRGSGQERGRGAESPRAPSVSHSGGRPGTGCQRGTALFIRRGRSPPTRAQVAARRGQAVPPCRPPAPPAAGPRGRPVPVPVPPGPERGSAPRGSPRRVRRGGTGGGGSRAHAGGVRARPPRPPASARSFYAARRGRAGSAGMRGRGPWVVPRSRPSRSPALAPPAPPPPARPERRCCLRLRLSLGGLLPLPAKPPRPFSAPLTAWENLVLLTSRPLLSFFFFSLPFSFLLDSYVFQPWI